MEWYEILGLVVAWVVGLYLRDRIYEEKNGYKRWNGKKKRCLGIF
jgi:predicted DCC family thiol-disulfide oxidoreductase YuxK